jgi:hypothetical protein
MPKRNLAALLRCRQLSYYCWFGVCHQYGDRRSRSNSPTPPPAPVPAPDPTPPPVPAHMEVSTSYPTTAAPNPVLTPLPTMSPTTKTTGLFSHACTSHSCSNNESNICPRRVPATPVPTTAGLTQFVSNSPSASSSTPSHTASIEPSNKVPSTVPSDDPSSSPSDLDLICRMFLPPRFLQELCLNLLRTCPEMITPVFGSSSIALDSRSLVSGSRLELTSNQNSIIPATPPRPCVDLPGNKRASPLLTPVRSMTTHFSFLTKAHKESCHNFPRTQPPAPCDDGLSSTFSIGWRSRLHVAGC